ncbi:3-methyl-2-oxobutanoate dehydrogenase subunit VorB [Bacteroidales bacterium OttesenSCG-928-B11]|nr:3-methyl-2-oxobutanoate dehydrogenase subunit VorB [Bacteroidales bacterium OttesenSCG-928-E04]MDL2308565.1 3-methyl-2-oxobutanoate dehydrogenase subunit VorB [Bacteroidales bacterium OttesenSCG-928-C03]MDL2311853.1 3-methyl-2-oxobutanoate dehydrogenase subunit VorB [Bacteroidales bacterium OttesenSCG-928-B11]MDL2326519.1 3-methyl-2-oxobutanoate dehydrogenase subunit VorB [Bacteroidales bacterium OttesenSCG-928-A14]
MKELKLMKGNEAIAEGAIRCGVDGYFGYPITPQSEVLEHLMAEKPYEKTGMVVLQAESEVASINMVYGGAALGKKVMTSSSSPGVSLMQEGISYMAGAELPGLVVNVVRGGPGLGTIQPSQADYFQTVKGGGHGDYRLITLAPAFVQEMYDFVELAFELSFKYRNPAMILSDGVIGQVMEKVEVDDYKPRWTNEYIRENFPWAMTGKTPDRPHVIVTSLQLEAAKQEAVNLRLQAKYKVIEENEVRYEKTMCDDAEYLIVAYGSSARISQKAIELAREQGIKVGLLRPITLWPFPSKAINEMSKNLKGILSVEMSAGQMVEDVRLAVGDNVPVEHFGRFGGIIPSPSEVVEAIKEKIMK